MEMADTKFRLGRDLIRSKMWYTATYTAIYHLCPFNHKTNQCIINLEGDDEVKDSSCYEMNRVLPTFDIDY